MRCRKAHEYISRSVDGELAGRRAARLERHLASCGECRAFLEDLREIVGAAPALAAGLPASGLVVGLRLGRQDMPMGPDAGEKYTLAKLDEAERYYQQAIKSLSEAFAAEKGGLAPQVVELFDRNLSVIDATIQACRRAVLEEPDDLEARNYLLAAYTQKVTLLDSALDLQTRDRDAAGRKKIL